MLKQLDQPLKEIPDSQKKASQDNLSKNFAKVMEKLADQLEVKVNNKEIYYENLKICKNAMNDQDVIKVSYDKHYPDSSITKFSLEIYPDGYIEKNSGNFEP